MFVTLTYNEEHVPKDYSLHKKDPVGFFKRLRSYLSYSNDNRQIKYYCCGEYGDEKDPTRPHKNHGRPHYHAIIFGLSPFNENDCKLVIEAWQHRCDEFQWDKNRGRRNEYGIGEKCAIQNVTPVDIEYVTGYVQKKLSGDLANKTYNGDCPPFAIMSKGLGLDHALQNADRLRQNGFTYLNGHKLSLPRYYRDKLEIDVDYTDIPKKSLKQFTEEQDYLEKLFNEDMKRDHIDLRYSSLSDLNNSSKRFERWYNDHRWQIADRVFRDFEQRQKMRSKL